AAACRGRRLRAMRKVEQMRTLGLVELKRTSKCLKHALRDTTHVPALEPGVVVDADAGEQRDLLTAKPRNAAVVTVDRQAGLVRRDLGSPGGQEVADLAPRVHKSSVP